MITSHKNILDDEQISFILNNETVLKYKEQLKTKNVVSFNANLSDSIKKNIKDKLNLDLYKIKEIPMRWIKGDTKQHIDQGEESFLKTFLIYLTNCEGSLVINNINYDIEKGSAFTFSEGLSHGFINSKDNEPRLMIGPMSEKGFGVGIIPTPCFLEGSEILCIENGKDSYISIEKLKPGSLVKTELNGYKKIDCIGYRNIQNPKDSERTKNRLYKCSTELYPELKEDLYITGCHSILVNKLTSDQINKMETVYVTGNKYRLMAFADERAIPYEKEGNFTVWHIALENDNDCMNYGVWANGLLVETISKRSLKDFSGMKLI